MPGFLPHGRCVGHLFGIKLVKLAVNDIMACCDRLSACVNTWSIDPMRIFNGAPRLSHLEFAQYLLPLPQKPVILPSGMPGTSKAKPSLHLVKNPVFGRQEECRQQGTMAPSAQGSVGRFNSEKDAAGVNSNANRTPEF